MKEFDLEAALRALYGERHDCIMAEEGKTRLFSPEEMAAYIDAELNQQDILLMYPRIYNHLDQCEACRAEYAEMKHLLALKCPLDESALAPPPSIDYTFLAPASAEPEPLQSSPWRLSELGTVIITFSQQLLDSFRPTTQQLTFAKETPASSTQTLIEYNLMDVEDLDVTISGKRQSKHEEICSIAVSVNIPSRGGWPNLAGTVVTLTHAEEMIAISQTDAFGNIIFHDIAIAYLPELEFRISPGNTGIEETER